MKKTLLWSRSFIKIWSSKTFRIMRCSLILLLISVTCALAYDGYSQSARVSLDMNDVAIKEVLNEIEKTSEFYFLYSSRLIDVDRKVNIYADNQPISDILDGLFANSNVDYVLIDRQIVLSPDKSLAEAKSKLQPLTVTGRVTDENGEPLPGLYVIVKGTTRGTTANATGEFTIDVDDPSAVLVFSFVGFLTQELVVGDQRVINVTMQLDIVGLEDIIVVGYGTQKKVNLTGSVAAVGNEELEKLSVTQTSQLLTGLVSGVTVTQSSGQPGKDDVVIRVRGLGTFSGAGNSPLILVDGLASSFDNVDINDIASISVLKDAASASIYGARGANGVILIETKKGQEGQFRITYQGNVGLQRPTEIPQIIDSWTYAEMYNEALVNGGGSPAYTAEEIAKFKSGEDPDYYPNTRHYDDLITSGSGFQTSHHLSFQGGTARNAYMFSVGYLNQDGLVAETYFKRYNVLLNVDSKLTDKLTLNVKLSGRTSKDSEPTAVDKNPSPGVEGLISYAIKIPNTYPGLRSDGTYGSQTGFTIEGWMDSESFISNAENNAIASINLDYEIIKSLTITGKLGYDFGTNINRFYRPELIVDQFITQGPSELRVRNTASSLLTLQAFINYDLSFGEHAIHFLGGYSQEDYSNNYVEGYRDNFPNNQLYELDAAALSNQQSSGSAYGWALRSFFGRVNYNFKGKYLFEANARYDGSSRFPEDKRFGLFPSVSAAWRLSQEDFFAVSWIDDLKLRASWGELGNQNIGNYPYQQVLSLGLNAPFGIAESLYPGAAAQTVPNKEITWESTRVVDIGFDLTVFNGKLNFSADYYDKLTSDILYNITASTVLGLTPSVQNAGVVSNKGIDLNVLHRNTFGDFSYSISGNFAYVKNEVKELANVERDISEGLFVGSSLESIYGYVADGLFIDQTDVDNSPTQPRTALPGDIKFVDISGPAGVPDGQVDADYDRKIIGNEFPSVNYGAGLSARYKGFDLSLQLQGVTGVDNRVTGYYYMSFQHGTSPQEWMVRERWTTANPNPDAKYPRFQILGGGEQQSWPSTYTIVNASYLRITNVQLGYTLPATISNRIRMSNLRLFLSVKNPFTFDHFYEGWDPELLTGYPPVRFFNLGINVTI